MKPEFKITDPNKLVSRGNLKDTGVRWSEIPTAPPQVLPWLTTSPSPMYVKLVAKIDGKPEKDIATWCSPFEPWSYVIYDEEVLKAQQVELIIKTYPNYIAAQTDSNRTS